MVTLLYHPFLLLHHYYAEIVMLSTNQISEISRLILQSDIIEDICVKI